MGIISGIGSIIKGVGDSVEKNWKVVKGDKAAEEAAIHQEQLETIRQFAAEFVARPQRTWWDSFVDGLNRLPRPIITFSIIAIMTVPIYDPVLFMTYMQALNVVPDELWTMWLVIVAFWFGSRIISEDVRKPKVTPDQIQLAKELVLERERLATEKAKKAGRKDAVPKPKRSLDRKSTVADASIDAMIDALLAREGGYVDHPADRGGPTNCGITQATLSAWREQSCSADDVKALTREEAAEIYRTQYYFAPGIDGIPSGIQAHVFDIAVNSGPRTAIKLLQRALNRLGASVKEDGAIGPQTRNAAGRYPAADINAELVKIRLDFYESLVQNDPSQSAFIVGWRKRANSFLEGTYA